MFRTMSQIVAANEAANEAAGYHFFDRDTLRFFRSRIGSRVYENGFFVTSEARRGCRRMFTIRQAQLDGSIKTFGEFQQYKSREAAHRAAKRAAKTTPPSR